MTFLRKGSALPVSATRDFSDHPDNVRRGRRQTVETTLAEWFDGSGHICLDEEIVDLGSFGYTLTVFSSDALAEHPDDDEACEEARLIESYTPRFAYGRQRPQRLPLRTYGRHHGNERLGARICPSGYGSSPALIAIFAGDGCGTDS